MRLLFSALLLSFSAPAFAFPEMVRHHYVNCNACHVNPSGGGLLTEYGRGMSGEVLSTWHYENESLFLHGALKPEKLPSFLNVGGDVRAVQVHRESRQVREGRYILMQTALEGAATVGPVSAVASYFAPDRKNHVHGELGRFYLLGNVTDAFQLKAGRFLPAFGIADPHHILSTRQSLGFGYGSNRDAAEAHYSGEQWHGALGVSRSRLDSALRQKEESVSFQLEKFFSDSYRVGVSAWRGETEQMRRWLWSLHGILGFTEHSYLLSETTWQNRQSKTPGSAWEMGIFHFSRVGYEFFQGFHLTALGDISETNISQPDSLTVMAGGGPIWYPRPHLEFELVFTQRKILRQSREWEDYAYLMLHYYL
ncbi:MAG TPA: hypothetical protein VIH99_05040 [Bdellovibrionota bacterium]|jgi:hypothetical protein